MFRMKTFVTTAAVAALTSAAGIASAATIFTDSFETPVNSQNWQVYPDTFGDWTSTIGTGIEIQRSGVVVNAQDGLQYVELDSDRSRGGDTTATTTNSSMTRKLDLAAGSYKLTWYYQPRTNTVGDNDINVYLAGASQSLLTNMIGSASGTGRNGWVLQTNTFSVDGTDNLYALTFIAGGRANTLGGFVDNVTLEHIPGVPVPAGMPLLLSGLALAGYITRRRKA